MPPRGAEPRRDVYPLRIDHAGGTRAAVVRLRRHRRVEHAVARAGKPVVLDGGRHEDVPERVRDHRLRTGQRVQPPGQERRGLEGVEGVRVVGEGHRTKQVGVELPLVPEPRHRGERGVEARLPEALERLRRGRLGLLRVDVEAVDEDDVARAPVFRVRPVLRIPEALLPVRLAARDGRAEIQPTVHLRDGGDVHLRPPVRDLAAGAARAERPLDRELRPLPAPLDEEDAPLAAPQQPREGGGLLREGHAPRKRHGPGPARRPRERGSEAAVPGLGPLEGTGLPGPERRPHGVQAGGAELPFHVVAETGGDARREHV